MVKFPFPLVRGLDTPAVTWSKTEMYNSNTHQYITVSQKRILLLLLLFFSSEEWVSLGERAGAKLQSPRRGGGELGISLAVCRRHQPYAGASRVSWKGGPPRDLAVPQSSSFLIPSAFRERDFTETNVLSSFFLSPLNVLKRKFLKKALRNLLYPSPVVFLYPKI